VGQQITARADHYRVSGCANVDAIGQPPEFLDAELADEPAGLPSGRPTGAATSAVGSRSLSTNTGDMRTP